MYVACLGGVNLYALIKDDTTGFSHAYILKHKSDVFNRFIEFQKLTKNKFSQSIKVLHTVNREEYIEDELNRCVSSLVMVYELTAPVTPKQNGKGKRDNGTIAVFARTLVEAKYLPRYL